MYAHTNRCCQQVVRFDCFGIVSAKLILALQELHAAGLLATSDRPNPPAPTAEQLRSLTRLDAALHESLRVTPPAPTTTVRQTSAECTLCGTSIPCGTNLFVSAWALGRSAGAWGPDSLQFRPGRWLEGQTGVRSSVAAARKGADGHARWLPFSDGRQNCIGQHLALVRVDRKLPSGWHGCSGRAAIHA